MSDTPIVDVPITGGVQFGQPIDGYSGTANDPGGGAQWGQYQWFDPVSLFCSDASVTAEECAQWCRTCASSIPPMLVNMQTLPQSPIDFPPWTPQNIAAYGICQIFWIWMWSYFVSKNTGVPENGVAPVAPPGTGNGGGTGGG